MTAEERRKHIRWTIQQNPTVIKINRTRKVRVGGGFGEEKDELGPFTVRIFLASASSPKEVSTKAGTKQTDSHYSLLADDLADIRKDSFMTDHFEAMGQSFEILEVFPQVVCGTVVGYQANLERVK